MVSSASLNDRRCERDPSLVLPTMVMPASSAAANTASPSSISVLPASIDSALAPADAHRLDRRQADDRHVEPHVLLRLRDLDDRARPGPARWPARPITSSVPSIASTATTAWCLTAIVWPMSSAGDRVGHAVAELEVLAAPRRSARACVSTPAPASSGVQQRRRVDQLDAAVAQHVGHGADQAVGASRRELASAPR